MKYLLITISLLLLFTNQCKAKSVTTKNSFNSKDTALVKCSMVVDKNTGKPLAGVKVELDNGFESTQTMTDESGSFSILIKPIQNYVVTFCKQYYYTEKRKFSTTDTAKNIELCVEMEDQRSCCGFIPAVTFEQYGYGQNPNWEQELDLLFCVMDQNPTLVLELSGHCDYKELNLKEDISVKRTRALKEFLIGHGIHADQLVEKSYKNTKPRVVPPKPEGDHELWNKEWGNYYNPGDLLDKKFLALLYQKSPQTWKEAMAKNRRVEISVLRNDFVPPGGISKSKTDCN